MIWLTWRSGNNSDWFRPVGWVVIGLNKKVNIRKEKSRIRKTETDKGRKNLKMKTELHKQIDWQEAAHRQRYTENRKTNKHRQTYTNRQIYIQAYRQTDKQTDKQADRQSVGRSVERTEWQTGRQKSVVKLVYCS